MKKTLLILSFSTLALTGCAKETFDSTCIGFSKSHWSSFTNDSTSNKDLCSCVKTELNKGDVSEDGVEALRQAMSASIVMRNRFESELNKAEQSNSLTSDERDVYENALGACLQGTDTGTAKEEEVNDMIEQFKALQ